MIRIRALGHSGVFCGVGMYLYAGSSMAHSNEPTPTFPGSVSKEILHIADEKFLTFTFRCRRLRTLNWIDQLVLHGCANCTPLRANPRTPWSGRLEYSSLRIPGVVQCYARCWIEEIGLRRIPKRSEEYLTRPPLSTHASSSIMSSLMMMARTHNRSPMLSVTDAWESGGETTQGFLPHLSRPRPKEGRTYYSRHHHRPRAEFCSCWLL